MIHTYLIASTKIKAAHQAIAQSLTADRRLPLLHPWDETFFRNLALSISDSCVGVAHCYILKQKVKLIETSEHNVLI